MRVFIDDDTEGRRLAVSIGTKSYVVAQGLEAGNHKIRIVKITEMQDATWEVQSFSAEGFFAAPAKSELKLEFIGDSITAGYGVLGKQSDQKTIMNSDASKTYAYLTAQKMNADYSVIAWSGICTKAPLWGPGMDVLYGDVSSLIPPITLLTLTPTWLSLISVQTTRHIYSKTAVMLSSFLSITKIFLLSCVKRIPMPT